MRQMKDSGIEWIGKIPETWRTSKLKYLGKYINGYAFKPEDWGNNGKRIIRIQDLTGSNDNPNFYDGEIPDKYHVKDGDILVSWAATLDAFVWNKGEGLLNQHIFKAIPYLEKIDYNYFFWMIKEAMKNMNNDNKHGIFMQHVTLDVFNNFSIPIPSIEEQSRIAYYLDQQCANIDAVIEKTKESIEVYMKLKQATITQVVTQGVRSNRKMKDSGIEWVGEIPREWHVKKLRYLGGCQNGISKSSEYFGGGYPFVSYGDVYRNYQLPETVKGLIMSTDSDRENYSVIRGDVLFTRTSETIEEVGFSCVCLKTIEQATFAGFVIRFRPTTNELLPEYSKYYFRSDMHRRFFVKEMNLVTRASLGQELLKKLPVILPPVLEQLEIAKYLEKKCGEIDRIIAKKEQYITELESYKKSLIYEYVTGKKEVPREYKA